MRVGDLPVISGASDGDCESRSFTEGRFALGRGMDFPLLNVAVADDAAASLGHGTGAALGHGYSEKSPLAARASNRPRRYDETTVVGDDGDRVDGV